MWPHPILQGMRYPGEPFAGLSDGPESPVCPDEGPTAGSLSAESAFERGLFRAGLATMALMVLVWVGCTGQFAIAVIRSQRSISRAITSLEADGFQVTREHVEVLVADGPGRLSAESARAMCRADFIYTYKISQGATNDPLPAEFAAVFEVTDVPPFREYKKRRDWQKLLSESP
ncbi:MAG: hypothetical protein U0836_15900 [Pirellulales bacterium]